MRGKLKELSADYVKSNIRRERLIEIACKDIDLDRINKEAQFYCLLRELFDDPEDNILHVKREDIAKVINNYMQKSITLEEFQLWFWDVLNLNIEGDDIEQELISYILYTFDNLEINGITDSKIGKVLEILDNISNADLALKNIKDVIAW